MLKFKKAFALVACASLLLAFVVPQALASQFADVPASHAFSEHIDYLKAHGVVSGLHGNFYPDNVVSRGEITKIVLNASGTSLDSGAARSFADVGIDNDFFAHINTAYKRGVIAGYGNGLFGPNDMVKRGEALKILVSAFGFTLDSSGGAHFVDVPASNDFYTYIQTAYNLGIISGKGSSFWPGNYMTRAEMAKIVAMAMQGGKTASEYTFSAYSDLYPQGSAVLANSTTSRLRFEFSKLPQLKNGYMYEAWLVDSKNDVLSIGVFNVDVEGSMLNSSDKKISNVLDTRVQVKSYESVRVTIEPRNDASAEPSDTLVLEGDIGDDGDVSLKFPAIAGEMSGSVFVSGNNKDSATFNLRGLPDVSAIGMRYEAMVQNSGTYRSLSSFQSTNNHANFKAQYGSDLTKVGKFIIGLEPYPDDASSPYIALLSVTVDSSAVETEEESWGTCDFDESIYDGLTTELTSESIICRTVEERDEDKNIIVQAYAAAEYVPANARVGIVIKVSDLEGKPISGLSLEMAQISGLQGTLTAPRERSKSGVYLGAYTAPGAADFSLSSSDVLLRISSKGSSSSQYVPITELSLKLKSSTRRGAPKILEIDVPQEQIVYDASKSNQTDKLMVLSTLMDNSRATIELSSGTGQKNNIKLKGSSSRNSSRTVDVQQGNLYLFELDMRDHYSSSGKYEVTSSENFQVEFYDRSSTSAYVPLISDQYSVSLRYLPKD